MKMKRLATLGSIVIVFTLISVPRSHSAAPEETLGQYLSDLRGNPDDQALREKIIRFALEMNPPPKVPTEARKHMSRGVAAVEGGKTPADFKDACGEFQQTVALAPWLGNGYRNLAIAQDKAGMYDEALSNLRFYLLTRPSAADTEWAEDLKAKVEYRKEKAEKAASPAVLAEKKPDSFEEWLKKLDGRRYTLRAGGSTQTLDVRGKVLVRGYIAGGRLQEYEGTSNRVEIRGRETTISIKEHAPFQTVWVVANTFIISEDGDRITVRARYTNGDVDDIIYLWQR